MRKLLCLVAMGVLAGCSDGLAPTAPLALAPSGANLALSDGGDSGLMFLLPLAPPRTLTGVFDAQLSPTVTVCATWTATGCTTAAATFTTASGAVKVDAAGEQYYTFW